MCCFWQTTPATCFYVWPTSPGIHYLHIGHHRSLPMRFVYCVGSIDPCDRPRLLLFFFPTCRPVRPSTIWFTFSKFTANVVHCVRCSLTDTTVVVVLNFNGHGGIWHSNVYIVLMWETLLLEHWGQQCSRPTDIYLLWLVLCNFILVNPSLLLGKIRGAPHLSEGAQ